MLSLQYLKYETIKFQDQYNKGEIGYLDMIGEAIIIKGKIERAADRGQIFKGATVRTQKHQKPVKCIWLEDQTPKSMEKVEVFSVDGILNVAYMA